MVVVEGGRGVFDGLFWNEVLDCVLDVFILVGFGLGLGYFNLGWVVVVFLIGIVYICEFGIV